MSKGYAVWKAERLGSWWATRQEEGEAASSATATSRRGKGANEERQVTSSALTGPVYTHGRLAAPHLPKPQMLLFPSDVVAVSCSVTSCRAPSPTVTSTALTRLPSCLSAPRGAGPPFRGFNSFAPIQTAGKGPARIPISFPRFSIAPRLT